MFGFVVCNKAELTESEKNRYQSVYCGVCRTLKEKYGNKERFILNYEMTFLALFLSSLYEPEEELVKKVRCAVHPFQEREALVGPYVDYAADMTILYTYYKCMDDWNDDKNLFHLKYARCLKRHMDGLKKKYPRQCRHIEEKMQEFFRLESQSTPISDELINASGEILKEIFVYREDCWSGYLRNFGYELGRFIYLMDAVIDYEKDKKSGKFNPFLRTEKKLDIRDAENILKVMIGNAAEQFEMLPLVRDEHLLKSILYDGVWTQFRLKMNGNEKETIHDR